MWAKYHTTTILNDAEALFKDFSFSGRISVRCSKAALAACIAFMISLELELQSNYWAPFTCLIMLTPYLGTTIEKGIYRMGGTIIGAFLSFIVFGLTIQNQFYYTLFVFIIATFCYYMHANSKHKGYLWFMIIQAFILISTAGFGNIITPMDFITVAFDRGANLIIGVVVYTIVNLLILPDYATNELDQKLKKLRTEVKYITDAVFNQYLSSKFNPKDINDKYAALKTLIKTIETVSHYAHFEKSLDVKSPKHGFVDYVRVSEYLDELINFYQSICAGRASYQSTHAKQIQKILELVESELKPKKPNFLEEAQKKINEQLEIINIRYIKRYQRGRLLNYSTTEIYLFQESITIIKEYLSFYYDIEPKKQTDSLPVDKKTEYIYDEFLGYQEYHFMGSKFFIHTPYLFFAIRTALTLIAVIWGWKFLELPTDNNTSNVTMAVMTCCVPDYVSSLHKGLLRFLGCSLGFLFGLILLELSVESTLIMLLCVFTAGYFSGRIMSGGPGISYMGLQAFLAFCVAFIPEWGPVTDLQDIFLRFIGIFFGVIMIWLISAILWKVEYFSIIKRSIFFFWDKFRNFNAINSPGFLPNTLIDGVSLIRGNISKLGITTDIPPQYQTLLKNWCNGVDRLLFATKNILSSSSESKKFIHEISPELIDKICELSNTFSFPKTPEETNKRVEEITVIFTAIEYLKQNIRSNHLFHDKDMNFRQETMKLITSLKRVVARLRDVNQIQKELYPVFCKPEAIKA